MKIAAIDIGSNSIHMVIVEADTSGGFRLVDSETEMVRLGAGTLASGALSPEAMQRALRILGAYRKLAELHQVDEILAVATSAIREARNGEDLLRMIRRKVDIWPRMIPGEEEARLVYLAALHSIRVPGGRALVIDLGGGSLELALGRGSNVDLAVSEKLGVLRMTERFLTQDPCSAGEARRLTKHVRQKLKAATKRIRSTGFTTAIGTSGTILALGRLALQGGAGERADPLHHQTVYAGAVRELRDKLTRMDLKARLRMGGMESRRADIIVAGAIILDTILEMVGAKHIVLCEWALREGVLLDFLSRHTTAVAKSEVYPDIRLRSVLELGERCQYNELHSRHVARLGLMLFDGTRRLHELGLEERRILEYAALLHDVGHHISHQGHHKHSYYLIRNGVLRGFRPEEVELLAQVARYHRGGLPRRSHPEFAGLPKSTRRKVQVLAGLLRLADALDRTQRQRVRTVRAIRHDATLSLYLRSAGEVELEMMSVRRRTELLEKSLGVKVDFRLRRAGSRAARRPEKVRKVAG